MTGFSGQPLFKWPSDFPPVVSATSTGTDNGKLKEQYNPEECAKSFKTSRRSVATLFGAYGNTVPTGYSCIERATIECLQEEIRGGTRKDMQRKS